MSVSEDDGVDGGVTEGEELAIGGEDEGGDLGTTKDAELGGLFEEAGAALGEGDLFVASVFKLFNFYSLPALGFLLLRDLVQYSH